MFGKEMIALQTRKRMILLESEMNRVRLRAELNQLREMMDLGKRLKRLKRLGRFGAWTRVAAPLAGLIAAVGLGRISWIGGLMRKALAGAPAAVRLWRMVSALRAEFR